MRPVRPAESPQLGLLITPRILLECLMMPE